MMGDHIFRWHHIDFDHDPFHFFFIDSVKSNTNMTTIEIFNYCLYNEQIFLCAYKNTHTVYLSFFFGCRNYAMSATFLSTWFLSFFLSVSLHLFHICIFSLLDVSFGFETTMKQKKKKKKKLPNNGIIRIIIQEWTEQSPHSFYLQQYLNLSLVSYSCCKLIETMRQWKKLPNTRMVNKSVSSVIFFSFVVVFFFFHCRVKRFLSFSLLLLFVSKCVFNTGVIVCLSCHLD